jgi:hypothetical protein
MASLVPAQEQLRGWPCGSFPFGRHPYADSRVRLTKGQRTHNNSRGGVLSFRVPTTPGMALQCLGWQHSGGDGRTGPKVMEESRFTGLTSRCFPARARGRRPYLFRGFRRPLSRGATWRPYKSGRHSVTELTLAFPHSSRTLPGMAPQGGLAEQHQDMIRRRCQRAGMVRIHLLTWAPAACRSI